MSTAPIASITKETTTPEGTLPRFPIFSAFFFNFSTSHSSSTNSPRDQVGSHGGVGKSMLLDDGMLFDALGIEPTEP
jgi:hypothetical protein